LRQAEYLVTTDVLGTQRCCMDDSRQITSLYWKLIMKSSLKMWSGYSIMQMRLLTKTHL